MTYRRWLFVVLLGTLFTAPPRADAQPRQPCHVPIDSFGSGHDASRLFSERLQQLHKMRALEWTPEEQQRLRKLLEDSDLQDPQGRAEIIKRLAQNAELRRLAEKWANGRATAEQLKKQLGREELEQFQRVIEEYKRQSPGSVPPLSPPGTESPPSTPVSPKPPASDESKPQQPSSSTPHTPRPDAASQDPEHQQARAEARQQLRQFGEYVEDVADHFRDSPMIHESLRELSRFTLSDAAGGRETLQEQLARFNRFAHSADEWVDTGKSLFGQLDLPSWPRVPTPKMEFPKPNLPSFNAPAMNVPEVGSAEAWYAPLWAGVLAAFGLVLWKLWAQRQPDGQGDPNATWHLGPWPVNPARIATPEELIRAFEYLSLLRFGRAARTWNHLDVAAGLGKEQPELQHAAEHLAAVYERARYAPASDLLSDEAIISARHHLCYLAGVSIT